MNEISSIPPPSIMRRTAGYGVFTIGVLFALYMAIKAWDANKAYKAWMHDQEQTQAKSPAIANAKATAEVRKGKMQQTAAVETSQTKKLEQPIASNPLNGTWIGRYTTYNLRNLVNYGVLSIGHSSEAIFIFARNGESDMRNSGCYHIKIEYDNKSGEIRLQPTKWIVKPPGYEFVAIKGRVDSTQQKIFGGVYMKLYGSDSYQGPFNFTRTSTTPSILPNDCKLETGG